MSTTSKGIRVLSLFDGISCGYEALERAGVKVAEYHAYEIKDISIGIAKYRHPNIIHHGDVTTADFSQYDGFDLCLFGFPCKDMSRLNHGGLGLDGKYSSLFWYGVEAAKHCKYFLCENVKMKPVYKDIITEALGVPAVYVDSAQYCAQSRYRLYWTNLPYELHPLNYYGYADGKRLWVSNMRAQDVLDDGIAPRDIFTCVATQSCTNVAMTRKVIAGWESNFKCYEDPNGEYVHGETPYSITAYATRELAVKAAVNRYVNLELGKRYRLERLNANELERLQTLPVDYTKYRLSNGKIEEVGYHARHYVIGDCWTVDVIADLLSCLK